MADVIIQADSTAEDPCWIDTQTAQLLKRIAEKKDYIQSYSSLPVESFVLECIGTDYGNKYPGSEGNILEYILESIFDLHTEDSNAYMVVENKTADNGTEKTKLWFYKDDNKTAPLIETTKQGTFQLGVSNFKEVFFNEGDEFEVHANLRSKEVLSWSTITLVDKAYTTWNIYHPVEGIPLATPKESDYVVPEIEVLGNLENGSSQSTYCGDKLLNTQRYADATDKFSISGSGYRLPRVCSICLIRTYSNWDPAMSGAHKVETQITSTRYNPPFIKVWLKFPPYKDKVIKVRIRSVVKRDPTNV